MGEVWKADISQLGRPVAIKALRGDLGVTQEVNCFACARKPIIPPILRIRTSLRCSRYYEHDGIGFLIMECITEA